MRWRTSSGGAPGLRLSVLDCIVIGLLCLMAWLIQRAIPDQTLYLLPIYLGLTFFLFCNVFRIGNRLEAIWYIPFTIAAAYAVYSAQMGLLWSLVWWLFEPLKWLLVAYRVVKGPYVGVFSRQPRRRAEGSPRN